MNEYQPKAIERLFLKQIRNLTRFNSVYATTQDDEDIYSEEGLEKSQDSSALDSREAAFMKGYLSA
jgi:hypothetical protein